MSELMTELDDLIGEVAAQSGEDELSLDSLLADSMKNVAQDKKLKESRQRLAKGGLSDSERSEIEAKVAEWELARLWNPAASVACFDVQVCQCGSKHEHFIGYFQRQLHKTSKIDRWVRVDRAAVMASTLPREIKRTEYPTEICADCAGLLHGWGN